MHIRLNSQSHKQHGGGSGASGGHSGSGPCQSGQYSFSLLRRKAACKYAHTHIYIYIYIYMYILLVLLCICAFVCMYIFAYVCMYACMHVCMYVCLYVCMYVYTYTQIYAHIYLFVCLFAWDFAGHTCRRALHYVGFCTAGLLQAWAGFANASSLTSSKVASIAVIGPLKFRRTSYML